MVITGLTLAALTYTSLEVLGTNYYMDYLGTYMQTPWIESVYTLHFPRLNGCTV